MNIWLTASALELAAALREGRIEAPELVEIHLTHLQRVNPALNAVVHPLFEDARVQAREAQQQINQARRTGDLGQLPPLLGVPCTIKENFQFRGAPQTAGLVRRVGRISDRDAPTVARYKAAGAIPLGLTNTSELCMWMESYNQVYGRSNNPYDASRTTGGSSGGEGAIIGAGASPFGLGADVGGSIRMPAFFNGVFGHKGSSELIPNEGQYPGSTGPGDVYLSTGPLCRRATDLPLLIRLLARRPESLGDPDAVRIRDLRILRVGPERGPRLSADQRDAVDRAISVLQRAGALIQTVDLPELDQAFEIWSAMLSEGNPGTSYADMMFGTQSPLAPVTELLKMPFGRSDHTLPLTLLALLEKAPRLLPARTRRLIERGRRLRSRLDRLLGEDGVLIHPPYPEVAPRHSRPLLPPFKFVHCAIFNAMELPATAIPTGLNAEGLPTGVQAVAGHGQDHLGLAMARFLEQALGGWVPPWEVSR